MERSLWSRLRSPGCRLHMKPGRPKRHIPKEFCVFSVDCVWNVMAYAQKPDFVFRRNGRVHLNRPGEGASVQSTAGSRGVRISGSNAGYTMFRGSVKGTGYPLPFASFPFTSPTVRHREPSHFNWTPTNISRSTDYTVPGKLPYTLFTRVIHALF